ncbi:helix-turn-helix transcriptional regulator [Nocardia sp. NPDC056064]|uniref:helix-turn-helix transcriptional regulator n=1 Tax=Nocardia sp. NPDC056064 TaxID=3345701 RepID=UPI0035DB68C5
MSVAGWRGAGALIRPGVLAFAGTIGATDRHAHHAVQIIDAHIPVTVRDGENTPHTGTRVIIPADTEHRIETGGATGVVVFLDPDSAAGRSAGQRASTGWTGTSTVSGSRGAEMPMAGIVDELLAELGEATGGEITAERHPAVRAAVAALPALVAAGPVRPGEVAALVGLSPSRLTHLFSAQVGLPLRRYILWLRLMNAVRSAEPGRDLTTIAHAAGFADSAHLTRTCREIFGLPPSALSRTVEWDLGAADSRIVQADNGVHRRG